MKIKDIWSIHKINFFLVYITVYFLFMSSILSIQHLTNAPKYCMFIVVFLGFCFYYIISINNSFIQKESKNSFLIISAVLIILLRLIWILAIPTLPYSDFEFYNNFAISIAKNIPTNMLSIDYSSRGFGYSFILGVLYKIFGVNLFIAKLLNIFLSLLVGLLLYLITEYLFNKSTARITTLLYAIWPSQIMYNSVLASEHLFIFFIFFGIAIFIGAIKVRQYNVYKNMFIVGFIFGLAYKVRFTALIVIATGFIILLFLQGQTLKNRLLAATFLILGFAIIWISFIGLSIANDIPSNPSTGIHNSLLMGTNYEHTGQWNSVDNEIWNKYNPEKAKEIAYQIWLSRIVENPSKFITLIFEKFNIMWGDDSYGVSFSTTIIDSTKLGFFVNKSFIIIFKKIMFAISQFYYFGLLVFSLFGCYKLKNKKLSIGITFLLMIFLFSVLVHSFLEVQSRYHYLCEVIFLILGGYGIQSVPLQKISE